MKRVGWVLLSLAPALLLAHDVPKRIAILPVRWHSSVQTLSLTPGGSQTYQSSRPVNAEILGAEGVALNREFTSSAYVPITAMQSLPKASYRDWKPSMVSEMAAKLHVDTVILVELDEYEQSEVATFDPAGTPYGPAAVGKRTWDVRHQAGFQTLPADQQYRTGRISANYLIWHRGGNGFVKGRLSSETEQRPLSAADKLRDTLANRIARSVRLKVDKLGG